MKKEHEAVLAQIAKVVPSGGNIGLNNPHDLPNTVDWLVPVIAEHGSLHMDEAREVLLQHGMSQSVADQVAYVVDVVDLALSKAHRDGLLR